MSDKLTICQQKLLFVEKHPVYTSALQWLYTLYTLDGSIPGPPCIHKCPTAVVYTLYTLDGTIPGPPCTP